MRGVNKVIVVGNVGKDPEARHTPAGDAVTNFSVAVNETWTDAGGQKQERTEWFRVVAWKRLAEIAGQYVRKGNPIYVEGRLQSKEWTDQQGVKRISVEINAAQIVLLPSGRDGDNGGNGYAAAPAQSAPAQQQAAVGGSGGADVDDVPF